MISNVAFYGNNTNKCSNNYISNYVVLKEAFNNDNKAFKKHNITKPNEDFIHLMKFRI